MKLLSHTAEKRGNAQVSWTASWKDHMRRPAKVNISFGKLEAPASAEQPMIEGDVKEVTDVMFAIAELAWESGWRPRGFPGALAAFAQHYKLPPLNG